MLKNTIFPCNNISFIAKQLEKLKINNLEKQCDTIREFTKKIGELNKDDKKINIIIPKGYNKDRVYLFIKGYDNNGNLRPVKKYTLSHNKVIEKKEFIEHPVIVLDLYEKSIYLHNYKKDGDYVTGYLIKDEQVNSNSANLVLSTEMIKVFMKNVNIATEYPDVDTFINKYYT